METTKSFTISKQVVVKAFWLVKANKGAPGVDKQTIEEFEKDLKNNLYKLWNRMSSGSYFPESVRVVEIPKADGKKRKLGIPTVTDRVAQMIVKIYFEPKLEKIFNENSYGYRPEKTAIQAVRIARDRCWKSDRVLDLDIKGFFDNIDHTLMMKAVKYHTNKQWVILYIERWLKASEKFRDGRIVNRRKGTPQGGVISPLLANLYLHYAFDYWMTVNFPDIPFTRYADDILVHCKTKHQVESIKDRIRERFLECNLELHPDKTKVVFCRDGKRKWREENEKFKFLGYEFRARLVRAKKGNYFVGFTPAVSNEAKKHFKASIRKYNLYKGKHIEVEEIAKVLNPIIYGWINYFWHFNKTETFSTLYYVDFLLIKWARKRYKKLKNKDKAFSWLKSLSIRQPNLFAHWKMGLRPKAIG